MIILKSHYNILRIIIFVFLWINIIHTQQYDEFDQKFLLIYHQAQHVIQSDDYLSGLEILQISWQNVMYKITINKISSEISVTNKGHIKTFTPEQFKKLIDSSYES